MYLDLSNDDTPMVRRAVAQNLGLIISISDEKLDVLLEVWIKLIKDEFDSVKICAVEQTQSILKSIDQSTSN